MRELWRTHADLEAADEELAALAASYARQRSENYEQEHGSLEGYEPRREFPCMGSLWLVDEWSGIAIAVCDACGFETTVRVRPVARADFEGGF